MYKTTTTDSSPTTLEKNEEINRKWKGVQDDGDKKHKIWNKNSTSKGKFKMWYNKNACNH
jgi:hypothetical protein